MKKIIASQERVKAATAALAELAEAIAPAEKRLLLKATPPERLHHRFKVIKPERPPQRLAVVRS